jgi:hypothetical protein
LILYMTTFDYITIIWFLSAVAVLIIAPFRGRSGVLWFLLGLPLGPFAFFILNDLPRLPRSSSGSSHNYCPPCGASIQVAEARFCAHCGKPF